MGTSASNRFLWGARSIADEIGQTEVAVYRLLERGQLPGARKVGGRWCFRPDIFARSMEPAARTERVAA